MVASTAALPWTMGPTAVTPGTRARALASARASGRTLLTTAPDRPMVLVLPGATADQVGAELGELREDEAMDPLADGGEQDHGRDPDGDAEHRQQAAGAIGTHGGQAEAGIVPGEHGVSPRTGPRPG